MLTRILLGIVLVAGTALVVGNVGQASQPAAGAAQTEATPTRLPRPRLRIPVRYVDADGEEVGLLTVLRIIHRFEDFDPADAPPDGQRYVLLTVTVENTGDAPLAFDPFSLFVRDATGTLYGERTVRRVGRVSDATPVPGRELFARNPIPGGDLAPGELRTGVAGFAVPSEALITQALFAPSSDRLLILAELPPPRPPTATAATPTADDAG